MTQFREAGLDTPDLDARLLVMAATGFSHTDMIARGTEFPTANVFALIENYAARRVAGEPVDHILGYREFYGRPFKVTKDVLSPRPETEMLVDAALEVLKAKPNARILDLGTGSGAIIISILAETKHVQGVAVDVSEAALDITRENAIAHDIDTRLTVLQGSWFAPVTGQFDLILSNPPYITAAAMTDLDMEVKGFDPDIALRGGDDGLAAYRDIIQSAVGYLRPDGVLLFEIGYDQGKSVSEILTVAGFTYISVHKDLAGHDRMIKAVIKA
jgi:release factor glutamine methyltransferase